MTPSTVLFDLDGVLVDSHAAFTASVNHALGGYGLAPRDAGELRRFIGPPLRGTFETLGVTAADVDGRVDAYRDHYAATGAAVTTVFDGIPEMLTALGARHRLVIATSKAASLARRIVEAALANGLMPIGATWGIGAEDDLRAAGAEAIVHHPRELADLL